MLHQGCYTNNICWLQYSETPWHWWSRVTVLTNYRTNEPRVSRDEPLVCIDDSSVYSNIREETCIQSSSVLSLFCQWIWKKNFFLCITDITLAHVCVLFYGSVYFRIFLDLGDIFVGGLALQQHGPSTTMWNYSHSLDRALWLYGPVASVLFWPVALCYHNDILITSDLFYSNDWKVRFNLGTQDFMDQWLNVASVMSAWSDLYKVSTLSGNVDCLG